MIGVGRDGPVGSGAQAAAETPPWRGGPPARPTMSGGPPDSDECDAQAVLASVQGLGPVTLGRLLAALGSARAVLHVAAGSRGAERIVEASRGPDGTGVAMGGAVARSVVEALDRRGLILDAIRRAGLTVVTLDHVEYPARLRQIEMPPPVLFVRGVLTSLGPPRAVAVVGTRRPTPVGRLVASRIAGAIGRTGAAVVSGLAAGIDGAAHAATVAEGGTTVAVLGGGHERLYPSAHRQLADEIVRSGGALLSELPPETEPTAGTFPRRNRVIAGLSDATVVVEAGLRSGALITAAWALEQGRPCYLVPGSLDAPASAGCLAFLRECPGEARIVASLPDLIEDLGLAPGDLASPGGLPGMEGPRPASTEAVLADLGPTARLIGSALSAGHATVDDLVRCTDLPVATVLAGLTLLETRGYVIGAYGRYIPSGRLASASRAVRGAGDRRRGHQRPIG